MIPSQLREALATQVESVVRHYLPQGKKVGNEWCAGSVNGEPGNSLKVQLTGFAAGLWSDFAGTEDSGDLIDLIAAVRHISLGEAIKEAKRYLGVEDPQFEGYHPKTYAKPSRDDIEPLDTDGPAMSLMTKRGLSKAVEPYKIAQSQDGTVIVYPYLDPAGDLVHVGYRKVAEKRFWASKDTRPSLFGWQAIPKSARSVVLTEGQFDAMAMYVYGFPSLSIPFGAGKGHHDWIATEWDALEQFETIYLAFDSDDAGQASLKEVMSRLGLHRCLVVKLPYKDANECLMHKVGEDVIRDCIRDAKAQDPIELRPASSYTEEVVDELNPTNPDALGFHSPWPESYFGKNFAFRYGETTVIAGVNGHGKSEGVGHITLDAVSQGVRACVASLEFKPRKWLARLARQALVTFHPSPERIRELHEWYSDKLWVFDQPKGARIDKMLEVFDYAYSRYGLKLFVIDNMSKCGIPEDDYNQQKDFIDKCTLFAVSRNVHIIVVAHMRKRETGKDHSRGGKSDFKGSGGITDLADNAIVWFRNKKKELRLWEMQNVEGEENPVEIEELKKQGDAIISVEKQRNGNGTEPMQHLFFHESHQFLANRLDRPRHYV